MGPGPGAAEVADRERPRRGLSLSGWILVAFLAGISAGLFFGELAAPLHGVATAFIRLLQMAVLPYVTVSLVAGLGSLSYREAGFIARQGGVLLLVMWALTFAVLAALPLAYPDWESASFFSSALVESHRDFDFVSLYIPSNPFESLSQSAVPAVVLFCIAVGVALIGVDGRETFIENLNVLSRALSRVTGFVVRLTPIGVFAIAASAAGTMTIEEFGRLQVYVITYVAGLLLVAFWILPGLVAALTPIAYRDLLRSSRDALVTAFSTGSIFVVLPLLSESAKELLSRHDSREESTSVVDVIVPVSFNFPHSGRLFAIGFVIFAAWFAGSAIPPTQYPTLFATGLFALFGSVNVAIPFLLDLFRVPADMFQLFLAVGILEGRFATLLGAVHILALSVLGACAVNGALTLRWGRLLRYAAVSVALGVLLLGGARVLIASFVDVEYSKYQLLTARKLAFESASSRLLDELPVEDPPPRGARLARIHERGTLRVGFSPEFLPNSYFNDDGELVGFDVELTHLLAHELGVDIEFVPMELRELGVQLERGVIDVGVGVAATTDRTAEMWFSNPLVDLTLGFVVRDHRRRDFAERDRVLSLEAPRIAVPRSRYYQEKLHEVLPQGDVVLIESEREFFESEAGAFDAMLHAVEIGSAWTLLYPHFSAVVPQPVVVKIPISLPLPMGEADLANAVNTFIELQKRDGTMDALYRHWILGRDEARRAPRWSVVRDLLHWVE